MFELSAAEVAERQARETFRIKRWRQELRRWEEEWKPAIVARNRAFTAVDVASLPDDELAATWSTWGWRRDAAHSTNAGGALASRSPPTMGTSRRESLPCTHRISMWESAEPNQGEALPPGARHSSARARWIAGAGPQWERSMCGEVIRRAEAKGLLEPGTDAERVVDAVLGGVLADPV